jgi:hypothetical protein
MLYYITFFSRRKKVIKERLFVATQLRCLCNSLLIFKIYNFQSLLFAAARLTNSREKASSAFFSNNLFCFFVRRRPAMFYINAVSGRRRSKVIKKQGLSKMPSPIQDAIKEKNIMTKRPEGGVFMQNNFITVKSC